MARLHEYQGKAILAANGFKIPRGCSARTGEEAVAAAAKLGGEVVIKIQAWTTGRAGIGGVAFAKKTDEVHRHAERMLSMKVGQFPVEAVLIEEKIDIDREFFLSFAIDDAARAPMIIFAAGGGSGIEERAASTRRIPCDVKRGPLESAVNEAVASSGLSPKQTKQLAELLDVLLRDAQLTEGLTRDQLLAAYRCMVMSRKLDDKEIQLKRQNRIYFQISGVGHEALNVASALHLRAGYDWFYPYYRDRALCLQLGLTPLDMLLQSVGAKEEPQSGGRQMPSHWSSKALNIVSQSSPTGTQALQAAGAAEASLYFSLVREAAELASSFYSDEVVYLSVGDGATSEGEFWECLNAVTARRLPVFIVAEDNGYAISVPVDVQTPGGNISRLVSGFPNLLSLECDGTNFVETFEAAGRAVEHVRTRREPALLHGHVIRPYSHSLSDDERVYKPEEILQEEARRDPLPLLKHYLLAEQLATEDELQTLEKDVDKEIGQAAETAMRAEPPKPESVMKYLYSPTVDPASERFDRPPRFQGDPRTMVDLINLCLRDEMRRDPRVVVFGEDVADCSHEDELPKVKGKGGVFKVTHGLQRQFGSARCFNAQLAEASIVGRAMGMATRASAQLVLAAAGTPSPLLR